MHTLKYVLLAISGASLIFASAPPTLTKRASWVAAFYKVCSALDLHSQTLYQPSLLD
jgi:hypothetical protein